MAPITIRYTREWIRKAKPTMATLPSSGSSDVQRLVPPSGGLGGAASPIGAGCGGCGQDRSGRCSRNESGQVTVLAWGDDPADPLAALLTGSFCGCSLSPASGTSVISSSATPRSLVVDW